MALFGGVCGLSFRCVPLTGYPFRVMPPLPAGTALTSSLGPRSAHCRNVAFLPANVARSLPEMAILGLVVLPSTMNGGMATVLVMATEHLTDVWKAPLP